jgi:hypothetical protein
VVNVESGGRVIYETGVSVYDAGFHGPFSGFTTEPNDSAIDEIRKKKGEGASSLTLTLSPGTEGVNLNGTSDLGAGLVLNSSNSPAEVTINGQGRTVRLDAGSANGSVITVGVGVTLTLKDIIFVGKNNNNAPWSRCKTAASSSLKARRLLRATPTPLSTVAASVSTAPAASR